MARTFTGLLNQIARDAARQQRMAERERQRQMVQEERIAERVARAAAKAIVSSEREQRARYFENRAREAVIATRDIESRVEALQSILADTLEVDDALDFESLKPKLKLEEFKPSRDLSDPAKPPDERDYLPTRKPPGIAGKLFPSMRAKYEAEVSELQAALAAARQAYERAEELRLQRLDAARQAFDAKQQAAKNEYQARLEEIDEFRDAYLAGDPRAITGYCSMVLERSVYPDGFPQEFRVAFVPESKLLVVDYELPPPEIVPTVAEIRYIKSKDTVQEKLRKASEIRDLYQEVVAAVTLRTCHELFESDQAQHFEVVAFNGFVQTVDPAIGRSVRPCLISVRATRERFLEIDLARVDLRACLRNLGAQVSARASEAVPVKPIVDFDMVDKRFVEQSDILADLESRPNLMDLDPFEFENLVGNLFQRHGLETKLTRSSRDGGVDVVAFDQRPVLGGKVVIQAKRWRNTVGVAAVRDLYGTMLNEGANKGILVTTSGYGPDAFDFAKGKPIELIDGGQLLYLLGECGVVARIVMPTE